MASSAPGSTPGIRVPLLLFLLPSKAILFLSFDFDNLGVAIVSFQRSSSNFEVVVVVADVADWQPHSRTFTCNDLLRDWPEPLNKPEPARPIGCGSR